MLEGEKGCLSVITLSANVLAALPSCLALISGCQ